MDVGIGVGRRPRRGRWGLTTCVVAACAGAAAAAGVPEARAQGGDAEACFSAAEQAQPLMKQRKLRAAAKQLAVCANEACPRAARTDCRNWLAEVARVEPTVVFAAREERPGGESRAVDDVRVTVDGEVVVASHLEVTAVPLDPGVHTLTFVHAGYEPVEQRLDVREGERDREVDVVFRAPPPAAGAAATTGRQGATLPVPPPPSPPPDRPLPLPPDAPPRASVPFAVYGLAGAGVVALGAGIALEAVGLSARSHLVDTCQPTRSCAPSDVDSARNQVLAGDIALGVGALLFAGAAYVYFTRDTPAPSSTRTEPAEGSLHLRLAPTAHGVLAGLEGWL
jgi:hypothetical protein